jgi:hypothetical protein
MGKSYTEEKFTVLGVNGRKQQVVFDRIPDADNPNEQVECLRIQEVETPNA